MIEQDVKTSKQVIRVHSLDKCMFCIGFSLVVVGFFKFCSLAQNFTLEMSHYFVSCKS